jgi:hypothetical protein
MHGRRVSSQAAIGIPRAGQRLCQNPLLPAEMIQIASVFSTVTHLNFASALFQIVTPACKGLPSGRSPNTAAGAWQLRCLSQVAGRAAVLRPSAQPVLAALANP